MIIDSHVHAGHADGLAHPWDTFADIEMSIERMDQCGIDKAVILPIGSHDFERRNREIAGIVSRYPERLFGYAKVNQEEDAGRIEAMLTEAFEELGLRGLKLHGHPNREIMEVMDRGRKPVLVDVKGQVYPLRHVVESYPEVPVIIAHMGQFLAVNGQVRLTTLWLAKRYPNVYFDTSSVVEHEWLEEAVREGLAHKMIFGSDGPVCHPQVELSRIKALALAPDDEEMVLWKNIARLLGETT